MDNKLILAGQVSKTPDTRHSPAGIPITRFVMQHQSRQSEAGILREVRCRILVMAAGEALSQQASCLQQDDELRVTGFISRSSFRDGETRLVLHAQNIETAR
ncbi:MAG: primosomal replication protein N [Gammaproteobacteria bacterium]|nr:primosomal replication protein N [Gammaproteobacteria bacterium]